MFFIKNLVDININLVILTSRESTAAYIISIQPLKVAYKKHKFEFCIKSTSNNMALH